MNTVIDILISVSTEKEILDTLDTFWIEYKKFNYNNDIFDQNELIWNSKDIGYGNSHLRHQKYSLSSTKVLFF